MISLSFAMFQPRVAPELPSREVEGETKHGSNETSEDRLCVPKDDVEAREPRIICSLGIWKD